MLVGKLPPVEFRHNGQPVWRFPVNQRTKRQRVLKPFGLPLARLLTFVRLPVPLLKLQQRELLPLKNPPRDLFLPPTRVIARLLPPFGFITPQLPFQPAYYNDMQRVRLRTLPPPLLPSVVTPPLPNDAGMRVVPKLLLFTPPLTVQYVPAVWTWAPCALLVGT